MHIKTIAIKEINPATYNPRLDLQPGDPDYDNLANSIDEFGYVEPLVWNQYTGNLVGGHQRLKVLIEKGFSHVEVSVVNLDEEKEKILNLGLNKISGDWDDHKLEELLSELSSSEGDLDLTGFSDSELQDIFGEWDQSSFTKGGSISDNEELDLTEYEENEFDHTCPKCGFSFNE